MVLFYIAAGEGNTIMLIRKNTTMITRLLITENNYQYNVESTKTMELKLATCYCGPPNMSYTILYYGIRGNLLNGLKAL